MKKRNLVAALGVAMALAHVPTQAATYLARIVSRANCLVPLPRLSPLGFGYTFNESISWDPKVWAGHYILTMSDHYRTTVWGGIWTDTWLGTYQSGTPDDAVRIPTWRAWSGKVDRGDTRELPSGTKPMRWVRGRHWEKRDGALFIDYQVSGATDCNITTW